MPDLSCRKATDVDVECFAIRRVNPFLGTLQIIETAFGRATSSNGFSWEIELRGLNNAEALSDDSSALQDVYYPYGQWSEDQGLTYRPVSLQYNNEEFTEQCKSVISQVEKFSADLPFKFKDSFEYWLLDKHDLQPLALLATATDEHLLSEPLPRFWACSPGLNELDSQHCFPAMDELEFLVKQRGGVNGQYACFRRDKDGGGTELVSGQAFPDEYFPVYLVQTSWYEAMHRELVNDYIEWIAPALLTLNLDDGYRQRLEKALHVQAISVEQHWRLYPKVINSSLLNAARVQSRLQNLEL